LRSRRRAGWKTDIFVVGADRQFGAALLGIDCFVRVAAGGALRKNYQRIHCCLFASVDGHGGSNRKRIVSGAVAACVHVEYGNAQKKIAFFANYLLVLFR